MWMRDFWRRTLSQCLICVISYLIFIVVYLSVGRRPVLDEVLILDVEPDAVPDVDR